jgi:hypothetical protein
LLAVVYIILLLTSSFFTGIDEGLATVLVTIKCCAAHPLDLIVKHLQQVELKLLETFTVDLQMKFITYTCKS